VRALMAAAAVLLLAALGLAASKAKAVTRAQALDIARRELAKDAAGDFVIEEARTRARDFGWVFFYAPRAYLKSGDPRDLVPGTGPLVVERASGAATFLSAGVPPDVALEQFEKDWRQRSARKR
jgi:hypothetical protein